jgi:transglutaminase-like putative cysteine protease
MVKGEKQPPHSMGAPSFLRALTFLLSSLGLVAVPTLTVWLVSSLIAFHGGRREIALAGGLLLFPILPLFWEWRTTRAWKIALSRRKQFVGTPKRTFTLFTRLAFRTLFICLLFTAATVARFPKVTFLALATRGDWFLSPGDAGEPWRKALFALAGGLEGLHRMANPNPHVTVIDSEALAKVDVAPISTDSPLVPSGSSARWRRLTDNERAAIERGSSDAGTSADSAISWNDGDNARVGDGSTERPPSPTDDPVVLRTGGTHWPWKDEVSPVVSSMQPHDETSIAAVARYIQSREPEPFKRVKALHDWVVTRLQYDLESLKPGRRKAQDPNAVFQSRVAVCEGYARLMVELGRLTGDQIVYIGGDVRKADGAAAPVGHAWNGVKVNGLWYLVDTTWDDPIETERPSRSYGTDYLFIPPNVAIFSHFPDDSRWQLMEAKLTRGDFLRQPFARPGIARDRLTLKRPGRATVDAHDTLEFEVENPLRRYLLVEYRATNGGSHECGVSNDERVSVRCPVAASGEAMLFSSEERYGTYGQVVSIAVTQR